MGEQVELSRGATGWYRVVNQDPTPVDDNGQPRLDSNGKPDPPSWTRVMILSPEFLSGGGAHMNLSISLHSRPVDEPPTAGEKSCGLNLTRAQLRELVLAINDFLEPPDILAELREISEDTRG